MGKSLSERGRHDNWMSLLAYIRLSKYNFLMDTKTLANLFKALSEPIRLRILVLLLDQRFQLLLK